MCPKGRQAGGSERRVYTSDDVSASRRAVDELLDHYERDPPGDLVARALFWIFDEQTGVDVENARLRIRPNRGPLLSTPEKSFHVKLRLAPVRQCSCDDIGRLTDDVGSEQEFVLVTRTPPTPEARTWFDTVPWMHYICLRRTVRLGEASRAEE